MAQELDPRSDVQVNSTLLGDAVSCNGVDQSAARREHMRRLTMARQAAERRYARPTAQPGMDRKDQLAAAQERAADLRAELARIDAEHRQWLLDHGTHVPELRAQRVRVPMGKEAAPA